MIVVLGVFVLICLFEVNVQLCDMVGNDIFLVQYLGEVCLQLGEFCIYELVQLSMFDQLEKVVDYNKCMDDIVKVVYDELVVYVVLLVLDKECELYCVVSVQLDCYFVVNKVMCDVVVVGDGVQVQQIFDEQLCLVCCDLFVVMKVLGIYIVGQMDGKIVDVNVIYCISMIVIIGCIVLLLLVVVVLVIVILCVVIGLFGKVVYVIQVVVCGDFSVSIQVISKDEVGRMFVVIVEMMVML